MVRIGATGKVVDTARRRSPSSGSGRRSRRALGRLSVSALLAGAVLMGFGSPAVASNHSTGEAVLTSSSTTAFTYANTDTWGTTWSDNPFSPSFPIIGNDLVFEPLALNLAPSLTRFAPQLATSWTAKGQQLTVKLRSGLKWQDGSPLTSKDVYDSALLYGTESTVMPDLSNITAPNPSEVVFTVRPGLPVPLAEDTILGMIVVPSSVYGRFVTPGLKQEELRYDAAAAANPTAASKSPAATRLQAAVKRLEDYKPATMVGDGPYQLKSITSLQAKLVKWPQYWGARRVHLPTVVVTNTTSNAIEAGLVANTLDMAYADLPKAVTQRWLKIPGAHVVKVPAFQVILDVNDAKYPLNLTAVRQAIAYVMPRKTMNETDPASTDMVHMDGITPATQKLTLTKKQVASLNAYPVDTAKAAKLLESAGFHKRGGQWITPKGTPFKLQFSVYAQQFNVLEEEQVAAKALDRFGIKSSVEGIGSVATWESDIQTGNFELEDWLVGGNDPLQQLAGMIGTSQNFNSATQRGIGFGPVLKVPGLGKVNVPQTITKEAASVAPGPKMDRLTYDWARLVNRELPVIPYNMFTSPFEYSTSRFKDWLPTSSDLWAVGGSNPIGLMALMFERGYIRPR